MANPVSIEVQPTWTKVADNVKSGTINFVDWQDDYYKWTYVQHGEAAPAEDTDKAVICLPGVQIISSTTFIDVYMKAKYAGHVVVCL